jgi:hypothetical protein
LHSFCPIRYITLKINDLTWLITLLFLSFRRYTLESGLRTEAVDQPVDKRCKGAAIAGGFATPLTWSFFNQTWLNPGGLDRLNETDHTGALPCKAPARFYPCPGACQTLFIAKESFHDH